MRIEKVFGCGLITHDNGRQERCESIDEAREVCHMMVGIKRLLKRGISEPGKNRAVPVGTLCRRGPQVKKKVRIRIDPETEFIKEKGSSVSLATA